MVDVLYNFVRSLRMYIDDTTTTLSRYQHTRTMQAHFPRIKHPHSLWIPYQKE